MKFSPQSGNRRRLACCSALAPLVFVPVAAMAQTPSPQVSAAQAAASVLHPEPTKQQKKMAQDAYIAGARLLTRNDLEGAEAQFQKAKDLDPRNAEYAQAAALAKTHRVTELVQQAGKARLLGKKDEADRLLAEAAKLDPQNPIALQHTETAPDKIFRTEIDGNPSWLKHGPSIAGPLTLQPSTEHKNFHLRGDSQDAVRQVYSAYGIRVVFDPSVEHHTVRFELEDSPYEQAVPILLSMTGLIAVPLDDHSVIVAKNSPENLQRLERQVEETIYVSGMSPQEMTELGNVIRTVFDVKQIGVQNTAEAIVVRAPEAVLKPLNLTLSDLLDGSNEVLLDLHIYSIDRTKQRNVGTQLPQQIGIYGVEAAAHDLVAANQTIVNQAIAQGLIPAGSSDIVIAFALISAGLVQSTLLSNTLAFFGGGLTLTGITIDRPASFHFALNASDIHAVDDIQLRVRERQPGTFRAGTRYPIITSTYTTGITGANSTLGNATINGVSAASLLAQNNLASTTIPQIQYEDLGFTLKATPTVQKSGRISLKLELKIEALSGSALNNMPILASRQYTADVSVESGETTMLASSLSSTESAAVNGIPGIGELPGFQIATATKATETDSSELVLLITPHLVRHRANATAGPRIALNLPGLE
jgi:type II secretory pathway component GspD/PulD (secretin)